MRFHTPIRSVVALALLYTMACESHDTAASRAQGDSVALANAAARELNTTLREAVLRTTPARAGIALIPGPSSWDTLLAGQLERTGSDIIGSVGDSLSEVVLSTHGFQTLGDTAAVHAVVRSCTSDGQEFAFFRDSMVLKFIRTGGNDSAAWRLAEPIDYDHVFGTCEPTVPTPSG